MKRIYTFGDDEMEIIISALSEYENKYYSQLSYYDELPDYERETHEDAFCEVLSRFNLILSVVSYISGTFSKKHALEIRNRFHYDK